MKKPIPIDLISGFLGAGKTTLISKYAAHLIKNKRKIAIIENEFGETGIDGVLLKEEGLTVAEITNGCICCSMQGDLIEVLEGFAQNTSLDRIIIEPTGLFIFEEISDTLQASSIRNDFTLSSVVTIIDSISFMAQRHKYSMFFEQQLQHANKILLSKTENLDRLDILDIMDILSKVAPHIEIFTKNWNTLTLDDYDFLFNSNEPPPQHKQHLHKHPAHTHNGFEGVAISGSKNFSKKDLFRVLKDITHGTYGDIPRAKGFAYDSHDGFWYFSVAEKQIDIAHASANTDCAKMNFIGMDINKNSIEKLFN
ncbi:MAG: GTP-binding protein [Clostridiales bacterium]|nr:GTP-binding protein [Clostridiales bacterium]